MLDGFELGLENILFDELPGLPDVGGAVQFAALGNRQETKQVVALRSVPAHPVNLFFEGRQVVEFFDASTWCVEEHRVGAGFAAVRRGAEDKAAGQCNGRFFIGLQQNGVGEHRGCLRCALGVAGQGDVLQPVEVCLRQAMGGG
ncbi:hypothetical protein D3C76_998120 [compost metagenome]